VQLAQRSAERLIRHGIGKVGAQQLVVRRSGELGEVECADVIDDVKGVVSENGKNSTLRRATAFT
jgi:hypothetical protein